MGTTTGPRHGVYLRALRFQRISTVIRPKSGRTTFTSTWTIEWPSFPLRLEGPAINRAFLNEPSREKPALPTSTERKLIVAAATCRRQDQRTRNSGFALYPSTSRKAFAAWLSARLVG